MPVDEDRDDIRELYSRWFAAMEAGDVEGFLALVTDDVVLKGPASPALHGKESLRRSLEAFHSRFTERVDYSVEEVGVAEDWAFARIREEIELRAKQSDDRVKLHGMHVGILRREDEGWRIARDVSSLDHPAPGA